MTANTNSWDQCAAVSCDKPRLSGWSYCEDCAPIFTGQRPPERKPMPIVEVVPSLVQPITASAPLPDKTPYREPATPYADDSEDRLARVKDLDAMRETLHEIRSAVTALQSSGSSPPEYESGQQLCDLKEITWQDTLGPGTTPIHMEPDYSMYFRPYGIRMIVTEPESTRRVQATIASVMIANAPQVGHGGFPAEIWDRHWPVPISWQAFSVGALCRNVTIDVRLFEPESHVWVGIAGAPMDTPPSQQFAWGDSRRGRY